MKYPLHFIVSFVQPITQHFETRTARKPPLQSLYTERNGATRPSYIHYRQRRKVKYPLRFVVGYGQLVTQQYESRTIRKAPLLTK